MDPPVCEDPARIGGGETAHRGESAKSPTEKGGAFRRTTTGGALFHVPCTGSIVMCMGAGAANGSTLQAGIASAMNPIIV